MRDNKVICIDNNGDDRLIINKEYWCVIYRDDDNIFIYCKNNSLLKPIGFFPSYLFKSVKQIRDDRLNDIL